MADPKKATKKNITDAILEALTTNKSLEDIIKKENYQPFKVTKSDVKFLVNNLGYIAQDRLSDLTDESLQKIKTSLGKRKFLELVTIEDATDKLKKVSQEYQKLTQKVGGKVKSATKAAKGKKK